MEKEPLLDAEAEEEYEDRYTTQIQKDEEEQSKML